MFLCLYYFQDETHFRAPGILDDWKRIAQYFSDIQSLPHCVGAIDGKHVAVKSPLNKGSLYFNYKGYFSTTSMGICDADYVLIFVDIGSYVSNNDSGIFRNSTIGKSLFDEQMNLPSPDVID